uniref:Uncharacterized protein n=1 Tax=Strigamia maritima TaxID=126957 RepID=T1JJF8_STRMM
MSVSSLIQPPKRASVAFNRVDLLVKMRKLSQAKKDQRAKEIDIFHEEIENILSNPEAFNTEKEDTESDISDTEVKDCLLYYLRGFVIRKLVNTSCVECLHSVKLDVSPENAESLLTDIRSKGKLLHPTSKLVKLLSFVENIIESNLKELTNDNNFSKISYEIVHSNDLTNLKIGCSDLNHSSHLTSQTIHFYITCRLFFYESFQC